MIPYFPTFYPDELLYSLLARFSSGVGYLAYAYAAQDLFRNRLAKPSIELVNDLTDDVKQLLTRNMPYKEVVEKHTMFPQYARFLPPERRRTAWQAVCMEGGEYQHLLYMPKNKNPATRYLRFCPLCAAEDRKAYGETYWHRNHQLLGIGICPKHRCYLADTEIEINSGGSPSLCAAEEAILYSTKIEYCTSELLCAVAEYTTQVFQADLDMTVSATISQFLHARLENTPYVSRRGEQRNMNLLCCDFNQHYEALPGQPLTELWQIQRLFTERCFHSYEICLMALFLGIPACDLVSMKLPEKSQAERFDEAVQTLRQQKLSYSEIARRLDAPLELVKNVYREHPIGNRNPSPGKGGVKKADWQKIDRELLPKVKEITKNFSAVDSRPEKISIGKVERLLQLPKKYLANCPLCTAEIEQYRETQEEYWAREVAWAVQEGERNGWAVHATMIQKMTHIRKRDLERCLPYLGEYVEGDRLKWIQGMLGE